VPRLVPLVSTDGEWRLDLTAFAAAIGPRTQAVFLNNAAFPTGWVASEDEWNAVATACRERDLWLI
jgi:N-succinyldiaminopimelate aminotransferase